MAQRSKRRLPPAPFLLVAVVVGGAIGYAGASSWLIAVVFAAAFLGIFAFGMRRALTAATVAPDGPVPCPRCDDLPRTASGWCDPCTALLREHPVPAGHPIHAFAAAAVARDFDAMAAHMATASTMRAPNGRRMRLSRRGFLRNLRMGMRFYRGGTSHVVAIHREPAEADSVWLRTHDTGDGFFGSGPVDVQLVVRYRFERGLIVDTAYFPPLPQAYSGVAA